CTGQVKARPKVAWLFGGLGNHAGGVGQELYRTQPRFRETLDRCASALAGRLEESLTRVLFEQGALLAQPRYGEPAMFALQMALASLWRGWGGGAGVGVGCGGGQYAGGWGGGGVFAPGRSRAVGPPRARGL